MNPNMNPNTLLTKWVLVPDGTDGFSLAGQVTSAIGDHHHLIRMNGPAPCSRLMSNAALCADGVFIFDSEAELLAWLDWEPDGDGPRIVPIQKEPV
jgi:hypothetical protein